ncbi:hypothetical protein Godav_025731 [Gossypium davidsonii]|uniref:Aspartic peptidase DDI1-type domain-containing protein n=1 Tax=Gossypium davidsonii TaxID=34287 RepID=A0A7J8T659_GOSDV|nr:hypothetical protein [Gossypium davidsonii]
MISTIKKKDVPEEAKPVEKKTSRVNSMVLFRKNRDGEEGLMFVDINIAGQKRSALVDTGALDLFISKKVAKKLGLSIRKSNKKIKIVNFDEASTVGVDSGSFVSMGRSNSYCHRSIIKNHCVGASRYEAPSERLVEHETYMRPIKSTVEPSPLGKVACVSDFEGKEAMQK